MTRHTPPRTGPSARHPKRHRGASAHLIHPTDHRGSLVEAALLAAAHEGVVCPHKAGHHTLRGVQKLLLLLARELRAGRAASVRRVSGRTSSVRQREFGLVPTTHRAEHPQVRVGEGVGNLHEVRGELVVHEATPHGAADPFAVARVSGRPRLGEGRTVQLLKGLEVGQELHSVRAAPRVMAGLLYSSPRGLTDNMGGCVSGPAHRRSPCRCGGTASRKRA
eukprot:scaffold7203_cov416-Prasinococcus_capsulatus_cf.AAC.2